jgi:hypothetical protein
MTLIVEPFGPVYPELGAGVAKYRKRMGDGGLADLTREERRAYADAIETSIRAKQRSALLRVTQTHNVDCASGTNHNCKHALHKALKEQQRSALLACPAEIRRKRTAAEWQEMYEDAMQEKRSGSKTAPLKRAA